MKMNSLLSYNLLSTCKFVLTYIGIFISGIFEWIVPRNWYAKAVDQDTVLITGAGSGLGRAIALEYARLNSSLVLWDINESGLDETKQLVEFEYEKRKFNDEDDGRRKGFCLAYVVDVSDREKIQECAQQVKLDLNRKKQENEEEAYVSVLVNNAGIYHGLFLQDLTDIQIERIFRINILAHFWTVRAFLPEMIRNKRGHIVEIASMGGIAGLYRQVDYSATKFATVGFEESLSYELYHLGLSDKIHTTVVCPFFFRSNLFTGFNSDASPIAFMSTEYVARETVLSMRCNHSRILLPKTASYAFAALKALKSRKELQYMSNGYIKATMNVKGAAAAVKI